MKLPFAAYIDSTSALRSLLPQLTGQPFLAIDTESNSLYAYREQVCLVQVSTRTADYLLDPLAIDDMSPLAEVMANPRIEKIFHAAEYDIMSIKRDFGFTINNIFDTMLAARICGYRQVGLNNLLEQHIGVQQDKRHQRDNWGERPLPEDSLRYAQMDTHFLPLLRNDLYDELVRQNRLAEARDAFAELPHIGPASFEFDPEGYWRIGKPKGLNRRQMAVLRELFLWREQIAEKRDCPPFKVISNETMVTIARSTPREKSDLGEIRGISPTMIRRYGATLLDLVTQGTQAKLPHPPTQPRPGPPDVMERYSALREWRKGRASQRGVDSDVIVSKNVLWALAEEVPRSLDDLQGIPGLGPWRLNMYGDELLQVLQKML
jgi:ribonuclease D